MSFKDKPELRLVVSNKDEPQILPDPQILADILAGLSSNDEIVAGIDASAVDSSADIIDFEVLRGRSADSSECSPATALKMALEDVTTGPYQHCKKAYITLILDNKKDGRLACNYRANLSRTEEIAYRQRGVVEAIDRWREDKVEDEDE